MIVHPMVAIADPDLASRRLLSALLLPLGWRVREFSAGNELLSRVAAEAPDFILLEVNQPDISGIELCRQLRRAGGSDAPVLLMAWGPDRDDILGGLSAGAADFLSKPLDPDILLLKLRNCLRMYGEIGALRAENRTLREKTYRDGLTGLYNRSYLAEMLREIEGGARAAAAVALLDVDDMKHVNDTFGHLTGDRVLRRVGGAIEQALQDTPHTAVRYGGDEFLILFHAVPGDRHAAVVQAICDDVAAHPVPARDGRSIPVTLGVGVCALSSHASVLQALREADGALLRGKRGVRAAPRAVQGPFSAECV